MVAWNFEIDTTKLNAGPSVDQKRVFEDMIESGIDRAFPSGLTVPEAQYVYNILMALDATIDDEIDVAQAEIDFLETIFNDNTWAAQEYRAVIQYRSKWP